MKTKNIFVILLCVSCVSSSATAISLSSFFSNFSLGFFTFLNPVSWFGGGRSIPDISFSYAKHFKVTRRGAFDDARARNRNFYEEEKQKMDKQYGERLAEHKKEREGIQVDILNIKSALEASLDGIENIVVEQTTVVSQLPEIYQQHKQLVNNALQEKETELKNDQDIVFNEQHRLLQNEQQQISNHLKKGVALLKDGMNKQFAEYNKNLVSTSSLSENLKKAINSGFETFNNEIINQ